MKDDAVKRWSAFHSLLFKTTRGRVGKRLVDNDMLLLSTVGRLSGEPHTVPLLYLRDEETLVVIASYGGRPRHPDWYNNLLANASVETQIGTTRERRIARTATSAEHDLWWPKVVEAYDGYATYQSRTDREIPVVFLEPPT